MFDILVYGLSVAVVGMVTVFLGLIILIGLVKALEKVVNGEALDMIKGKVAGKTAAPAAQTAADDSELIAVITAAVAAMLEAEAAAATDTPAAEEKKATGFVVRSIRRISTAPAWNRAGREEQVYSRM